MQRKEVGESSTTGNATVALRPRLNDMQIVESNQSNNEEILAQIHLWIFEHGLQYGMRNVVKSVLSKYQFYECIKNIITSWRTQGLDEPAPVNPDVLFLYLVEKLKKSIVKLADANKDPTVEPVIDIDFELLNVVVDLIENIYRRTQLMAFHTFACFIARLKLTELVCRIAKKENSQTILKRLDILFPKWDSKYEGYITSKIRIPDKTSLNKLSSSHSKIRRYILELLSSEEKRQNYLHKCFADDINDILKYASKHLEAFPKFAKGKLPPTAIDQIISGAYVNTGIDNEPAVRILLDNLNSQSTAKDFLVVLDMLSPDSQVSLKGCFDEFSESEDDDSDDMIPAYSNDQPQPIVTEQVTPVKSPQRVFHDLSDTSEDLFLPQGLREEPKESTSNATILGVKNEKSPSGNQPSTSKDGVASDEELPVKRRLYTNLFKSNLIENPTNNPEASIDSNNQIHRKPDLKKFKRRPTEVDRLNDDTNNKPAPHSVKLRRRDNNENKQVKAKKKIVRKGLHHMTLKKLQRLRMENSNPQNITFIKPEIVRIRDALISPYKNNLKKSLRIKLTLRGTMLDSHGYETSFYG